jgi:hypothetical protein
VSIVDSATQAWVKLTGRTVVAADHPWLDGPVGTPEGIGPSFFDDYAARHHGQVVRVRPVGLLPSIDALASSTVDPKALAPAVISFYERTSEYELDAWSQWSGPFRPFGVALALIFSRRLQQLNVPLGNLDTSRGMTSEVFEVRNARTGVRLFTAWVRQLIATGHVIYAGAYSVCRPPLEPGPCVRVVFPLPNGNAMVVMRASVHPDGSLSLISAGTGFGSAGFYFTVRRRDGRLSARYLRSLREQIHVYAANGSIDADHVLSLWGVTFLRLHYRLRLRA